MFLTAILLTAILLSTAIAAAATPPRVRTDTGLVEGVADATGAAFIGIPYAQPPVGELRWRAPQRVKSWAPEVLKLRDHPRDDCAQPDINFYTAGLDPRTIKLVEGSSEDCLYLDVYTPSGDGVENSDDLLPVFVFIPGGEYQNACKLSVSHTFSAHLACQCP